MHIDTSMFPAAAARVRCPSCVLPQPILPTRMNTAPGVADVARRLPYLAETFGVVLRSAPRGHAAPAATFAQRSHGIDTKRPIFNLRIEARGHLGILRARALMSGNFGLKVPGACGGAHSVGSAGGPWAPSVPRDDRTRSGERGVVHSEGRRRQRCGSASERTLSLFEAARGRKRGTRGAGRR